MGVIPVRFKRVAAVFDEEARARLCESSGTEHSGGGGHSLTDLSNLVDSFIEDGDGGLGGGGGDDEKARSSPETNCSDSEIKDALEKLFSWESGDSDRKVKMKIHALVAKSLREVDGGDGEVDGNDFKRGLMARLRQRGLDAGICKSKWGKDGRRPAGDYEYIDVNASGGRYIVEVSLAQEFTIARPTNCYSSLLNIFPHIFVGKQEELKKLTKLMCTSMKNSMKKMEIEVPPWRRVSYMQAKWFGTSYRRTTNEIPAAGADPMLHVDRRELVDESRRSKRSVGFVPAANVSFMCREGFSAGGRSGGGMRVGNLAAVFNDNSIIS